MKRFLEDMLHQPIELFSYSETGRVPLILRANYNLYVLVLNEQSCIIAEPKEEYNLTVLRKQQRRLELLTEKYCVLYFRKLRSYTRDKMLEEGIPFIWENHQIYMPFIGMWLKQKEARELKPCTKISFLTQKLLLVALYDKWQNITVTVAAELLQVTKMSITRCYDEIESLGLPIVHKKGRTRVLSTCIDRREMWELIKPYMRNPLFQEFYLAEDLSEGLLKSGISALCEYSMLNDNEYITCAINKSQLAEFGVKYKKQIPKGECPVCIVQELGYTINYRKRGTVDPLTVYLLLEKDILDPRVDKALEEMLEEYVW